MNTDGTGPKSAEVQVLKDVDNVDRHVMHTSTPP
jgi:hypothetical protein